MNLNSPITKIFATLLTILFSATVVCAHSNHDHSKISLKWNFSQELQKKIENKIREGDFYVGLSSYEQKLLNDYNIKIGNIFRANVLNKAISIKKASSGLQLRNISNFSKIESNYELPFRNSNVILKISLIKNHPGHDHSSLPVEWIITTRTKDKISERIIKSNSFPMIGLNSYESKTLNKYNIKVGNTFKLLIQGITFDVKRVSAGIIFEKSNGTHVASLKQNDAM